MTVASFLVRAMYGLVFAGSDGLSNDKYVHVSGCLVGYSEILQSQNMLIVHVVYITH